VWLQAGSVKAALSRPAHQRVPITAPVKGLPKNHFLCAPGRIIRAVEENNFHGSFFAQFIFEQATLRHPRHCL
jgi:hypothetical protein